MIRSFIGRALAVGILLLSASAGWAQVGVGRPITSTPTVPGFQFTPGNPTGFSNPYTNGTFFPADQFRGGFFPGNPFLGTQNFNNTPFPGMRNFNAMQNPFGNHNSREAFAAFLPFLYYGLLSNGGVAGYGGYGGYGGYPQVISSFAGSNQPWQPTPNSYYYYRPDIAYTAMLNTVGNPPGPGVSPMAVPPQTSGEATLILRLPEGAELSVNGKNEKATGAEQKFTSQVLQPGQTHTFHIKAAWYDNGVDRALDRTITLGAGESKSLMILPGLSKVEPPRNTQP
jgi:uncharacterized protein (TIGR03000 family)